MYDLFDRIEAAVRRHVSRYPTSSWFLTYVALTVEFFLISAFVTGIIGLQTMLLAWIVTLTVVGIAVVFRRSCSVLSYMLREEL